MEGQGRMRVKDKVRFYRIAFGSTRECQAILDLAQASPDQLQLLNYLAASLYRLIEKAA